MIYQLTLGQQAQLLSKPETGMGYQVVEANTSGFYSTNKYIILNEEYVIPLDGNASQQIKNITNEAFRVQLRKDIIQLTNIKLFSKTEFRIILNQSGKENGTAAIDSPKRIHIGGAQFVRLSAFENDRRVDTVNNCLRPESFTTSLSDYMYCKINGEDPVERYALPNEAQINWVFHIKTASGDIIQSGTVQPAFNKEGGGEEYYFEYGTAKGTYQPPAKKY